jgi:hypothetical protein
MNNIFFYGLFMDRDLLAGQGLEPTVMGPAVLRDFRLHIGRRATLVRSPGHRALGIVMGLTDADAEALYAEPSVREYIPEPVQVELLNTSEIIRADCYNLPSDLGFTGANPSYAAALAGLAEALGFESGYVAEIAAFAGEG